MADRKLWQMSSSGKIEGEEIFFLFVGNDVGGRPPDLLQFFQGPFPLNSL